MKYSSWSLKRAEQREAINTLALLATLFSMQPRIQLVFQATSTLSPDADVFTHQILLLRTALNSFPTQPVSMLLTALTQLQDLTHSPAEVHEVCMGPPLKPSRTLWMASLPSNLSDYTSGKKTQFSNQWKD